MMVPLPLSATEIGLPITAAARIGTTSAKRTTLGTQRIILGMIAKVVAKDPNASNVRAEVILPKIAQINVWPKQGSRVAVES